MNKYVSRLIIRHAFARSLTAIFAATCVFYFMPPVWNAYGLEKQTRQSVAQSLFSSVSRVPIPFVVNEGQIAEQSVKFYARTFGGSVYVTDTGRIVYSFPKFDTLAPDPRLVGNCMIREILCGARQSVPEGVGQAVTRVNWFIGNDRNRWKSNLRSYERVHFGEVYNGIEFGLRAYANNVEKIFTVAPGADPGQIKIRIDGADHVEVTPDNELELTTALGKVRFSAPVAYQVAEKERGHSCPLGPSPSRKESVQVAYVVEQDIIGFELGHYDKERTLVIDPFVASTFIGGGNTDVIRAMAIDDSTNVYVTGYTASSDFPTTTNIPISSTNLDAFISKFDSDLENLLSSTFLGGSQDDKAYSIAINPANTNVYIAGYTDSTNFPPAGTPYCSTFSGNRDGFVSRLNSDLSDLVASTYLGGSDVDVIQGLALDSDPNVYVAGYTSSTNFPQNPITNDYATGHTNMYMGSNDVFVTKLGSALGSVMASTYIGATNDDVACALAIDISSGDVYITGYTDSTNFPRNPTNNVYAAGYTNMYKGGKDVFVTRMAGSLTNLINSTYLGGAGNEEAYGIDLDFSTNVYIAGYTESTGYPRSPKDNVFAPGYTNCYMGAKDAFVTRLGNSLTNAPNSTLLGYTNDDVAYSVLVAGDSGNTNVYVTGYTLSSNFPITRNVYDSSHNGNSDVFLSYFQYSLTNLTASTYIGGSGNDAGYALALDAETNRVFVAGASASANFPVTAGAYQQFPSGGYNGFVSKLSADMLYGSLKWQYKPVDAGALSPPAFGSDGTIYVADNYGNLYAVSPEGQLIWENYAGNENAIRGAPAVSTNGTIYFCTHDVETENNLFSVGPDCSTNWGCSLGRFVKQSPAIGTDGMIYGGCFEESYLYAINPNGTTNWKTDVIGNMYGSPVIGTNGQIYVSLSASYLYSMSPSGTTNWRADFGSGTEAYSSPAIGSNGTIYVGSGGKLWSVANNGTINWSNQLAGAGDIWSAPVIDTNGVIYIGNNSDNFVAINPNGTTKWTRDLGGDVKSSAAIGEDGTIFVGSDGGWLYAFNPDGTTNWTFNAGDVFNYSAPLLASDGTVFFSAGDNLFAIFGNEKSADGDWPMFQHDLLRTRNSALGPPDPVPPTGVSASVTNSDRVRVSWNSVSDATLYEVWRCSSNDVASASRLGETTRTWYDDGFITTGYNYYYWVKSKNPVKTGSLSSPGALGGVPTLPPEGVTATDGFPTNLWSSQVHVTWTNCSGATGYRILRSTGNTNSPAFIGISLTTNYDDTTMPPGLTNYYWVKSHNLTTTSDVSSVDSGGIPPSPPTGVAASQGTLTNALKATWNSSPGATVYELFRGTTTVASASTLLIATGSTIYNDTNTIACLEYTYWTKATNVYGISGYSTSATGHRALAPPITVNATDGTFTNKVKVSWSTNKVLDQVSAYRVFRSTVNDPLTASQRVELEFAVGSPITNYADQEIDRGATYYYWLKAKNVYGISTFSPSDVGGTAPRSPLSISASDGTYTGKVAITWNSAFGATGYQIYRLETADSSYAAVIGTVKGTNYDDTAVSPGTRYFYWVKSTNTFGKSALSGFDSGWRDLSPPTAVDASDGASTGHLWVTWSASENATAYELWRGTNSDSSSASELENYITTNSYDDLSSIPGQVYYFWVKAKNVSFTSGFSDYDIGYRALGSVDIGVSDFIFLPSAPAAGENPDAVSFHLTNHGNNDMALPNAWVASDFYLSLNAVFGDSDDVWIGRSTADAELTVGSSTVITLSQSDRSGVTIPSSATGTYYVFVYVQHTLPSTWNDPKTTNNSAQRAGGAIQIRETASVPYIINDFTGDGKADLAVYHDATGLWFVREVDGTLILYGEAWGGAGFMPVVGDFDGDGKVDLAVYKEETGQWYIRSVAGSLILWNASWGGAGFVPVWGDYDGDRKVDLAVYHEESGTWYIRSVAGSVIAWGDIWGGTGYTPVCGDYNREGRTDLAVYAAGDYNWFIRNLSGSVILYGTAWGGEEQFAPVPGDYDGDGISDLAVYHETSGYWFIMSTAGVQIAWGTYWGGSGFVPVPGDYDGDGKTDLAVYHTEMGLWFIRGVDGTSIIYGENWGGAGFTPVSLAQ